MTKTSRLSVRVDLEGGGRLGPGKAALLEAIAAHGTISKAAGALSMSYPRALKLIDEMNRDFAGPLVESKHGGAERGGSDVTALGLEVLACYRQILAAAETAGANAMQRLRELQESK